LGRKPEIQEDEDPDFVEACLGRPSAADTPPFCFSEFGGCDLISSNWQLRRDGACEKGKASSKLNRSNSPRRSVLIESIGR
jgi:hypothetical protein